MPLLQSVRFLLVTLLLAAQVLARAADAPSVIDLDWTDAARARVKL